MDDEVPGVPQRDPASARDRLRQRYPGREGTPTELALALIEAVRSRVGAPAADRSAPDGAAPVEHLLAALVLLRWLRVELDTWEPHLIAAARERGASWVDLASALGVASRQAAERRYLRVRVPDEPDGTATTREGRVSAERDRRAGDRAISQWARDHGADLRQLAGQITSLTGLDADAQTSVDRLHHALGATDLTTLVQRLADTRQHLSGEHTTLAERVDAVTRHADHIRHNTRQRRERRRHAGRTE
jgi:hypothetical protein